MTTTEIFLQSPMIGILRVHDARIAVQAAKAAVAGGLRMVEVTTDSRDFERTLGELRSALPDDVPVGAGTVRTEAELAMAMRLGAQFIVTPVVVAPVIQACVSAGLPIFPGAFTPTEIWTAHELGATAVKLYPAGSLGAQFVRDLRSPLHGVKMIPTGQVTPDRLADYLLAGAFGCGLGTTLFLPDAIQSQNWSAITEIARRFARTLESHRAS